MWILSGPSKPMQKPSPIGFLAQAEPQNMEPVESVVRSMSSSTDNFPHTGAMIYNDSFPKIPALAVGLQDADKLVAEAQTCAQKIYIFIFPLMHMLYPIQLDIM